MASALCRPSFLRTQSLAPFIWRDTTTAIPAIPPEGTYNWYAMVPGKIANDPPPTPPVNVGEVSGGIFPAGAVDFSNRAIEQARAAQGPQYTETQEREAEAYRRALSDYNESRSGRVAVRLPATEIDRLNRYRTSLNLAPIRAVPMNVDRNGYPPLPATSGPQLRNDLVDSAVLSRQQFSKNMSEGPAHSGDPAEPAVVASSDAPIDFVDEASARRARCDALYSAIPGSDRNNPAMMAAFLQTHGECAESGGFVPICPRDSVPASFATQAEKDAFILANPGCTAVATSVPVVPACTTTLPGSFPTQADKDAFVAANPACAAAVAPIPVAPAVGRSSASAPTRDWTPYYVAGGVLAGVGVLGTIAYFALREPPELEAPSAPARLPASSSNAVVAEWRRKARR